MPDYYNSAFHARDGYVYHIEEACPEGNTVPRQARVSGKGGLPMCGWCQRESARREVPSGPYYNHG
jgi:hypothetical protein